MLLLFKTTVPGTSVPLRIISDNSDVNTTQSSTMTANVQVHISPKDFTLRAIMNRLYGEMKCTNILALVGSFRAHSKTVKCSLEESLMSNLRLRFESVQYQCTANKILPTSHSVFDIIKQETEQCYLYCLKPLILS